jgi:hypothetical protein
VVFVSAQFVLKVQAQKTAQVIPLHPKLPNDGQRIAGSSLHLITQKYQKAILQICCFHDLFLTVAEEKWNKKA